MSYFGTKLWTGKAASGMGAKKQVMPCSWTYEPEELDPNEDEHTRIRHAEGTNEVQRAGAQSAKDEVE